MICVELNPHEVEEALDARRLLCPACAGGLSRWGYARIRAIRTLSGERHVRPRRARCHACRTTHVVLPTDLLSRRRDDATVIGDALRMRSQGHGYRYIAARSPAPVSTVRRWLRRFRDNAPGLIRSFSPNLPPERHAPQRRDRLESEAYAVLVAAAATWGFASSVWNFAARATNGRLLATPNDL